MFFTDGSKTREGVGASVIHNENKIIIKTPNACSIFTAKAIMAISHTLDITKQNNQNHYT